ncbi:hypothetical protein [Geomobilimonas luticola]|uniref:Uncharacterized protein n=1 Tax=Geomobilimonas luticola TaxID=1114878 RepID=A0ABS5SEF0_9BACT|nr:hypothetical protein [Geomobilimonas luticola]MBT0653753.1 hypothetical protein [Geomobilimonas luticola]
MMEKIYESFWGIITLVFGIGVILYIMSAISLFSYITILEIIQLNYKNYLVSLYITSVVLGCADSMRFNLDRLVIVESKELTTSLICQTFCSSLILSVFMGPVSTLLIIKSGLKQNKQDGIVELEYRKNSLKANYNDGQNA